MTDFMVVTKSVVDVFITSNIASFTSQKKFDKSLTIADLKCKLEMITGGSAATMKISVLDKDDKPVCKLDNDSALLGSYPIDDGHRLDINDTTRTRDEFENLSKVDKFELTKDEYSQKTDTLQAYLKKNKLGKYNEEEMAALAKEKEDQEKAEEQSIESRGLKVDSRCQVTIPGQLKRRGVIRFVGKVEFQPGWWVGIHYDEPNGKNDGSVKGKRYFTCPMKHGGFVKPNSVEAGDFPELGLSDDEM